MKTVQIVVTANKGENAREMSFNRDFPVSIAEAVKVFGEAFVFDHFEDSLTIAFQARARGLMAREGDKRLGDKDITEKMVAWVPKSRAAADPQKKVESIKATLANMDPKARAALLKELAKA